MVAYAQYGAWRAHQRIESGIVTTEARTKRCVIADDVRASRELLSVWLGEFGYISVLAGDGESARIAVESISPDLVITDIEMPHCTGLELLFAIRNNVNPVLRVLPVIVISSLEDDQLVQLVRPLGANCVLSKPLEKLVLKAAVESTEGQPENWLLDDADKSPEDNAIVRSVSPKLRRLVDKLKNEF